MLIDLIVGSALLLFGLFTWFWMRSPALRERIERPKHVFLEQAQAYDATRLAPGPDAQHGVMPHE